MRVMMLTHNTTRAINRYECDTYIVASPIRVWYIVRIICIYVLLYCYHYLLLLAIIIIIIILNTNTTYYHYTYYYYYYYYINIMVDKRSRRRNQFIHYHCGVVRTHTRVLPGYDSGGDNLGRRVR